MIVDDEEDILLTYNSMLHGEGYNVESFSDPHEALLHFIHADKSHYDLVILDIRMPNLNGLQLYHRLKTIDKDIKILFVCTRSVRRNNKCISRIKIWRSYKKANFQRKLCRKDKYITIAFELLANYRVRFPVYLFRELFLLVGFNI